MDNPLDNNNIMGLLVRALMFILSAITLPVQALLNRGLGERYLSVPRMALSLIILPWIAVERSQWTWENARSVSVYRCNVIMIAMFALVMIWQWIETNDAIYRRGLKWHSRSHGVPWNFLGPDGKVQRLGLQPGLCLFLGAVISHWSASMGRYFCMSAALLFLGAYLGFMAVRYRILDMNDSVIEQQALTQALSNENTTTEESFGMQLQQSISQAERNNAPALIDIINDLNGRRERDAERTSLQSV